MSTPLRKVVDDQLTASGMAGEPLDDAAARYVAKGVESVLSSLRARRAWERHLGQLLTHKQMLEVTGWTKQNLSQAVREHRVLRLEATDGTAGYWSQGLTETEPHRPLAGLKDVLRIWAQAGTAAWTVASWLSTPQPELGGRTPRQALSGGDHQDVAALARQAAGRLAS